MSFSWKQPRLRPLGNTFVNVPPLVAEASHETVEVEEQDSNFRPQNSQPVVVRPKGFSYKARTYPDYVSYELTSDSKKEGEEGGEEFDAEHDGFDAAEPFDAEECCMLRGVPPNVPEDGMPLPPFADFGTGWHQDSTAPWPMLGQDQWHSKDVLRLPTYVDADVDAHGYPNGGSKKLPVQGSVSPESVPVPSFATAKTHSTTTTNGAGGLWQDPVHLDSQTLCSTGLNHGCDASSRPVHDAQGQDHQAAMSMAMYTGDTFAINGRPKARNGVAVVPASMPQPVSSRMPAKENGQGLPAFLQNGITTLMVRNLPLDMLQNDLIQEVERCGLLGACDFLYMPSSFGTRRGKGYAFVNFTNPGSAETFYQTWHRSKRFGMPSNVSLNVSAAVVQGRDANVARWDSAKMRRVKNANYRPHIPDMSGGGGADGDPSGAVVLQTTNSRAGNSHMATAPQLSTSGYDGGGFLYPGTWVQVGGLLHSDEMNGRWGVIEAYDEGSQRFLLQLAPLAELGEDCWVRTKVHRDNLSPSTLPEKTSPEYVPQTISF